DNFPDLSKNKIPKKPIIKEEPDVEKIEVEFSELNVVKEMIRILKSMEDEMNINNFEDGNNWDQVIQYFDWSILLNNYQQMTQLYRMTLYYKKMLERVPANLQITYQYIQNILIINEIKPYKKKEDIIVRKLNLVKWMFQQIHGGFVATKIVDDAKNLYDRWNVYILSNIEDDNYFQYKSKTEEYLAMIFAEWIKYNVVSGTDLPPGIPDAIAGARRK
ncbi:27580_t:CDS:2, partial [Racocetra persica]